MKEIRAIVDAYDHKHPDTRAALATVVHVEGSSYRRTGARMLIQDNGTWVGGISGGCLEGDALKRARLVMAQGKPTIVTYDTTDDDGYQIGVGLGCNGIISVLLSPIDPAAAPTSPTAIDQLRTCAYGPRQTNVLLSVLASSVANVPIGIVLRYEGVGSLAAHGFDAFSTEIQSFIEKGKSTIATLDIPEGRIEVFVEVMRPVPHVVLMGQQYDVYPMVRLVNELGWQATVVANPQKVSRAMFSSANALLAPADFDQIQIDDQTAFVLMAHDYNTDAANLPRALATGAPYVGVLGPRIRTEKMVAELAAAGTPIQENDQLHAPIGLDIGAVSPEEIALSVMAEIRAALSGREGSFLRLRQSPIHER
jgi:xanthine dehydrogenase accessory factor